MAGLSQRKPYLKLVLLVGILAGAAVLVRTTPLGGLLTREGVAAAVEVLRGSVWAPAIFVVAYAAATAVALPGSVLTIAGGALFGFGWGAILNSLGANLGANAAFLVARGLGREGIERLGGNRVQGLNRATAKHGFAGLLVLRLVPLVPFNALNFGSGLSGIRWRDYALATVIGILPGTLVYTLFADALMQGSTEAGQEARLRLWIAAGLLLVLSLVPIVARKLGFRLPSQSSAEVSQ